ncbi:MAG: flagellar protein FlaG [Candidatus Kapabacteria bacterium]|nr:flagellar protein FlaG [Candidatus Kapabacteria bacterium]MCS7169611.1 flagellar protein FlaG [Candidatus Kapabacteria bacterium]MDW7997316.1 flagellar protein FlaG [Bacteroidota bacterium]MDW8225673.1 flagellar protein FlaG [Bacteroidota bacterium]
MITPIQPITHPTAIAAIVGPERVATEGEGGYGRPPSQQPAPPASASSTQVAGEAENESHGTDFSIIVSALQSVVEQENIELEFTVDEATQKLVLRVRDAQTKQILQQIPPEIALRIARFVMELLQRERGIADVRA